MEFEALVCYSQLLILLVIAVAYLYHYRPGPHAKWTFSVIACGLLLFVDALLLPAGGWLQLALKAVMIVAAIALALFFAAAMMILAAFARTFKDGQAMVGPVMMLAMAPIFLGQQTDQTLTPVVAAIPVANAAMMIRDAINGVFLWPLIAETLAVLLAVVTACLLIARVLLKTEDFLLLSPGGRFSKFSKMLTSRARRV